MKRTTRIILIVAGIVLLMVAFGGSLYTTGSAWWPWVVGAAGVVAILPAVVIGVEWHQVLRSRALYYGASSTILTAAIVAIVVLVNIVVGNHHVRWDLTPNKLYSLSDQTLAVLDGLTEDVTMRAFVRPGTVDAERITDLLKEYTYRSNRVRMETIDPNQQPSLAREYNVTAYNTIVVEAGGKRRNVQPFDLFSQNRLTGALEFFGEQAVTRALIGVSQEDQGSVYFTAGHGERDPNAEFAQVASFLRGEGYNVQTLNIAQSGGIPEDTALLIIAGAARDFAAAEVDEIRTYLQRGGAALIMVDPTLPTVSLQNLKGLIEAWGVTFRTDIVVDPERHYFVDVLSPIPNYVEHAVTEDLIAQNLAMVMPRTRSLEITQTHFATTPILQTSAGSWGESTLPLTPEVSADGNDAVGPLDIGVALYRTIPASETGTGSAGQMRLIVVGSSSFATNDTIGFQGNVDFFMNSVNWLTGREQLITIRPKVEEFEPAQLSGATASVIFYSTVVFIPALFLVLAGAAAWRRRNL